MMKKPKKTKIPKADKPTKLKLPRAAPEIVLIDANTFTINGLKVYAHPIKCPKCLFRKNQSCGAPDGIPECTSTKRHDRRSIGWKEFPYAP